MVGKGNYRRSLESGTRKPRPKGVGSAGREARPGRPLPVTSEEKGALSVARRTKGSGGHPGKRNGRRHGERTEVAIAEQRKFRISRCSEDHP